MLNLLFYSNSNEYSLKSKYNLLNHPKYLTTKQTILCNDNCKLYLEHWDIRDTSNLNFIKFLIDAKNVLAISWNAPTTWLQQRFEIAIHERGIKCIKDWKINI